MHIHKTLILLCGIVALATAPAARAQYETSSTPQAKRFPWPDAKRAAISFTFDDARLSQVDAGLPLFKQHNIKATFYLSPGSVPRRLDGWKQAVAEGHEMGNHTLNHPCTGNFEFARLKALEDYTLEAMEEELAQANEFIRVALGVEPVSFAYPCGQTFVGRGEGVKSYVPLVARRFRSGRLWLSEHANDPWFCDPAQLLAMESDGKTFDELKASVDAAAQEGRWLILAGHEIGTDGRQTTLVSSLNGLCTYLNDPDNGFWVAPVGTVTAHVLEQRPAVK